MSKPLVIGVLGARGSGKSAWIKQQLELARWSRLLVWDPMREYGGVAGCVATSSLAQVVRAMRGGAWRIAYQPPQAEAVAHFELLCRAAMEAGDCCLVVDELAFVTTPSRSPRAWRNVVLLGRHRRVTVMGGSQRPASIDKDFVSCCDVLHVGRLGFHGDARAVFPFLGLDDWRELMQLPDLHYLEKQPGARECLRGVLSFGNSARKKTPTRPTRRVRHQARPL